MGRGDGDCHGLIGDGILYSVSGVGGGVKFGMGDDAGEGEGEGVRVGGRGCED